jgi:hypothetical protein
MERKITKRKDCIQLMDEGSDAVGCNLYENFGLVAELFDGFIGGFIA